MTCYDYLLIFIWLANCKYFFGKLLKLFVHFDLKIMNPVDENDCFNVIPPLKITHSSTFFPIGYAS